MILFNNLEDSFVCPECGREMKEYYRSVYDHNICVHCDTSGDYDDDYPEDDSESPWNE